MDFAKNRILAKIFYEIAEYLEMEGVEFKPRAYRKAAFVLEGMEENIESVYAKGGLKGLESMPGIGKSIALKIEEYLKTGKIRRYQEYKKSFPLNIDELISVQGIGPKKAKTLYQKLKIKNLDDLEKAAKKNKIAALFGFDKKTEKNILESIAFLKKSKGRFLLGEILPLVEDILKKLKKLKQVEQISVAGSVRRKKETVGDVDILITAKNPQEIMGYFVQLPGVVKVWMKGPTRSSVRMEQGFDIDLRVVKKKNYGSTLQYFTGSKDHNIVLRKIAIEKKLKLSEYGLFRGSKMIAGWDEKEIYRILGLDWIEPELRENRGEIEAAQKSVLPELITVKDIKGDLHCHSDWSGGENTIEEMAESAIEMNYQYLGIADHTKFLKIENGLDERRLSLQKKEIDKINLKISSRNLNFRLLHGCEANILTNGSIDIKNSFLKKMDFVVAGVHSGFKMSRQKITERIIKAVKNPEIDIISHPTGRILKKRDEYQIDFDKILRAAKQYNKALEINSYPKRMDLNDLNIYRAKQAGVKMVINSDAHHKDQLDFIGFGVGQARRGWAEKKDIINTDSFEKLLKNFR